MVDDRCDPHDTTGQPYDLIIVGTDSGNMLVFDDLAHWRVAVVEADRFGGTCLNRGCIPSKMLVHTADVAQTIRHRRPLRDWRHLDRRRLASDPRPGLQSD